MNILMFFAIFCLASSPIADEQVFLPGHETIVSLNSKAVLPNQITIRVVITKSDQDLRSLRQKVNGINCWQNYYNKVSAWYSLLYGTIAKVEGIRHISISESPLKT